MKTLTLVLTAMVFMIAAGTAIADEMPTFMSSRDVGTELYISALAADTVDDGKGFAAGGKAGVREHEKIWDALLAPIGASDLP